MATKLLVEGLPPSFSNQQLPELFAPFGMVLSASVLRDPAGNSFRMGDVEMSTPREAERAMQKLHRSYLQGELLLVFERIGKVDLPRKKRNKPNRLKSSMGEQQKADHPFTVAVVALTAIVFTLDLMSPLGIAVWTLYVLPLGLTRWSTLQPLTFMVAGACTVLIVLGYLYSPPGVSQDFAISNRILGVLMVWITAFFLKVERI